MSDVPWTLGPWLNRLNSWGDVVASGLEICTVWDCNDEGGATVYEMPEGKRAPTENEARANARLIAAAPEMADELAIAAGIFEHYAQMHYAKNTEDGDEKGDANKAHAVRIRALLSRIRGDAP